MRLNIRTEHEDGTVEQITATVPDLMRWEKTYGTKTSDLANGVSVTDLAYLAWAALTRTKATTLTFEKWSATLVNLEQGEAPEPRPTQPEASPDSSSS